MKKIYGLSILILLMLGTGCVPMKEIDVEVLIPAEITLPLDVQQLAFLNHSVIPRLLHPDSTKWTDEEYYILDTIMNNWMFQGIRQSMKESPLYDLDTIRIIRSRRYDTSGVMDPLTDYYLQRLKMVHPADAVISLDYYDLKDSSTVYMIAAENSSTYTEFAVQAYLGLYTTSLWRIYDLIRDTIFDEYIIRDTLTWYHAAETVESAVDGLPKAVDALRAAAFNTGTIYGNRISPGWMEVQRYYHSSGGREMRLAANKAARDDWSGAVLIWEKLAYSENLFVASWASFNMALVCEIEDRLIEALDWAIRSYSIKQKPLTREYIDLLRKRYEHEQKLRKQVPAGGY
jgi:hypothetical protein